MSAENNHISRNSFRFDDPQIQSNLDPNAPDGVFDYSNTSSSSSSSSAKANIASVEGRWLITSGQRPLNSSNNDDDSSSSDDDDSNTASSSSSSIQNTTTTDATTTGKPGAFVGKFKVKGRKEGEAEPVYTLSYKIGEVDLKGVGITSEDQFITVRGPGKHKLIGCLTAQENNTKLVGSYAELDKKDESRGLVVFSSPKTTKAKIPFPGGEWDAVFFKPQEEQDPKKKKKKKDQKAPEPRWVGKANFNVASIHNDNVAFNLTFSKGVPGADGSSVSYALHRAGSSIKLSKSNTIGFYLTKLHHQHQEQQQQQDQQQQQEPPKKVAEIQDLAIYKINSSGCQMSAALASYGINGFGKESADRVISKQLCHYPKHLKLRIIKARNVVDRDHIGCSDPYCQVQVISGSGEILHFKKDKYQTKWIKNNLNPVWNETFEIELDDIARLAGFRRNTLFEGTKGIRLNLMEHDRMTPDEFCGLIDLTWADVDALARLSAPVWYELKEKPDHKDTGVTGEIKFSIKLVGTASKLKTKK